MILRRATYLMATLAAGSMAAPAAACLPPPPGYVEPSLEERVRAAFEHSTDIVYGVVTQRSNRRGQLRFEVRHVYKGDLKRGARLTLERGFGLNPHPCIHMLPPPPIERGARGVILFHDSRPTLTFLEPDELELMFAKGWIARSTR